MDVLVTGADTELGRTIAEGFRDADLRSSSAARAAMT